jgi:Flp pilus assembly pilin Flp
MTQSLKKFWQDERAAVAVEAVIITPILAWLFVASFVFFDAFRTYNTSLKATYAVADFFSRQTEALSDTDIDGLNSVFQFLTRNTEGSEMRVTLIRRARNDYRLDWSYATGGRTRLRRRDLVELEDRLPIMERGERLFLVETFLPYVPAFNVGIAPQEFVNFTVTRPRFAHGTIRLNQS